MSLDHQQLRQALYDKFPANTNLLAGHVRYQSQGHVLLIGPEDLCRLACQFLPDPSSLTILVNQATKNDDLPRLELAMQVSQGVSVYYDKLVKVNGFLGQFKVDVEHQGQSVSLAPMAVENAHFDIVMDLGQIPTLAQALPPPGYFYLADSEQDLQQVAASISDYIGVIEKPRYVEINPALCAHSRNDLLGCSRCLDVCSADAISIKNLKIEINQHVCHGSGECTSICPTGAIAYQQPQPLSMLQHVREIIANYYQQGKSKPMVVFYDDSVNLAQKLSTLAQHVLPFTMEEIGALAIEHMLATLALGAEQVVVICHSRDSESLLRENVAFANSLLEHLGYQASIHIYVDDNVLLHPVLREDLFPNSQFTHVPLASFGALNKRELFYAALDHLNQFGSQCADVIALNNAPYGTIEVDTSGCTLCMACVSACPTAALQAEMEQPILRFHEQACVQCHLCEQSCPEKVINLKSQINLAADNRNRAQIIKQEQPFHCIRCNEAFATTSMVERMMQMLSTHSAFAANPKRLQMCADCRVKDMVVEVIDDPNKQLR
ncbi:4Fe-4S binding protein [Thalassotalea aquiviva]|uniref:4Fe-4S binding protein n=1 Tax=Thalassotalea aquiviva TaxID=3242415 RepID=UPI00352B5299